MKYRNIGKIGLTLCLVLFYISTTESLVCFTCPTGKCDTLEEEECKPAAPAAGGAAGASTAAAASSAAAFIERDDTTAAPAAGGAAAAPAAAGPVAFQCVTLKAKAKGGGGELTLRGCSPDGTCTQFAALVDDGGECTPCAEDKCNSGEHVKPVAMSLLLFAVFTSFVISQM